MKERIYFIHNDESKLQSHEKAMDINSRAFRKTDLGH
jgi:hypothetical protein